MSESTLTRWVSQRARVWWHDVRLVRWHVKHLPRILQAASATDADPTVIAMGRELRENGIIARSCAELIGDPGVCADVSGIGHQMWAQAKQQYAEGALHGYAGKEYKVSLLPAEFSYDHPFVQFALHPRLLALVHGYLGMAGWLRAIDLWWDRPTTDVAKETQLWHRDYDDVMNLKLFVYLNDVDEAAGPFCFLPQTHPRGLLRALAPARDARLRTTDEQMAAVLPSAAWRICTGASGTAILCDTCGYHKGLKPVSRERLLLMVQYTSPAPYVERAFNLIGQRADGLTRLQQCALSATAR